MTTPAAESKLFRLAGLPSGRDCKPQRLRRSHATHLKAAGGDPTLALGHSSEEVTRRYYLDPVILGDESPAALLPPIAPPA